MTNEPKSRMVRSINKVIALRKFLDNGFDGAYLTVEVLLANGTTASCIIEDAEYKFADDNLVLRATQI